VFVVAAKFFLSSAPPKFRSAAACRVTIDLHFVHSSVLPWCIICKGHPRHSAKLKSLVALLRICSFDQTPDTCFLLERFSLARVCLQEMCNYYFASDFAIFDWISKSIMRRTRHNWSAIQKLNEAFQPWYDSIFPVCVQPLFANQALQKTMKRNQLNNGGDVQILLQVVNCFKSSTIVLSVCNRP